MAVPERSVSENASIPEGILVYKSAIKLDPILEALEKRRTSK
jgi:hypothetical protein